jgi:hypothetical protein
MTTSSEWGTRVRVMVACSYHDTALSGERKRVRCNELLGGDDAGTRPRKRRSKRRDRQTERQEDSFR